MMPDSDLPIDTRDEAPLAALQQANRPARASVRFSWGNIRFQTDAEITPIGLLAVGGMVGAILLTVAPIMRAALGSRRTR